INRPRDSATLKELIISGEWATTSGSTPQPFLVYDNRPDSDSRVIAFANEQNLRLLARSDMWMMDGNFAMAPPKFMKLMFHKTHDNYEELFKAVLDKCRVYFLYQDPSTVILDFEQAIHQTITAVLGTEVICHGCFYHLTQASWRKIQEFGLVTIYKDSENVKLFCGLVESLALLPLEDIPAGIDYLKNAHYRWHGTLPHILRPDLRDR
ncbi:putative Inosine-5'-monophosphate dehydrogenase 1b-like 10, partial [Homarus americanus]